MKKKHLVQHPPGAPLVASLVEGEPRLKNPNPMTFLVIKMPKEQARKEELSRILKRIMWLLMTKRSIN